jgi:hypothetical protein
MARFFSRSVPAEDPTRKMIIEAPGAASAKDRTKSILKKLGLAFTKSSGGGRDTFEGPAGFSFTEIEKAYLTDSYVRQACDKYVDYMFKAGYDIVGKDPKAVEYIKIRLQSIAVATEKPLWEFLTDIAEDIIKYHNVFIIKARAGNSYQYPANVTVTPVLAKRTVAGYFILPASTITIARSNNGTITKYLQKISGQEDFEIAPADMIHVAVDRPQGRAFGFPFLWQALDDVKLLRQMEELTDRMVYKNIFPLMVYQVGLEKDGFQATDEEIEEVRAQLAELPMDGGIVVPERHKIMAVSVGDKIIDVSAFLEYFKKRVFTGLGVSATIMGEADTSNRSTSDNLDQMFKDRIKAYQRAIEENINSKIIYELLLEGGYDPLINVDDVVEFKFREIDLQAKMAEQNHIVQLFTQNAITHEQMRLLLGYDAVTPEEEQRLYFRMVTIPTAVETANATSAAQDAQAANNAGANKNQPANQSGTRTSAKTTKNSMSEAVLTRTSPLYLFSSISGSYESMKSDCVKQVNQYIRSGKSLSEFDRKQIALTCNLGADYMASVAAKYAGPAFIEGVSDAQNQAGKQSNVNITYNIKLMNQEFKQKTVKLAEDLMDQIERTVRNCTSEDAAAKVVGVFSTLQYRLKFISTTQLYNAYNEGFAKAARDLGYSEAYISDPETGCEVCGENANKPINLMSGQIPPFHPNCSCRLTLRKKEGSE